MENQNPYQSPEAYDYPAVLLGEGEPEERRARLCIFWLIACSLNMIIPMLFGWDITSKGGRIGMFIGVGFFLLGGCVVCAFFYKFAKAMVLGSAFFCLTQLFPIIQMFAGMLAMGACSTIGLIGDSGIGPFGSKMNQFTGFLLTIITGMILLTLAIGLGLIIQLIYRSWKGSRASSTSYPLEVPFQPRRTEK